MKNKLPNFLCLIFAFLSLIIANLKFQSKLYFIIASVCTLISFLIAIFMIVLRDKSSKGISYLLIIFIGIFFLFLGYYR